MFPQQQDAPALLAALQACFDRIAYQTVRRAVLEALGTLARSSEEAAALVTQGAPSLAAALDTLASEAGAPVSLQTPAQALRATLQRHALEQD